MLVRVWLAYLVYQFVAIRQRFVDVPVFNRHADKGRLFLERRKNEIPDAAVDDVARERLFAILGGDGLYLLILGFLRRCHYDNGEPVALVSKWIDKLGQRRLERQ